MGKRAASGRGGIVIAQEVTKLVEAKKDISGPEVIAALKDKFPGIKFNEASVQVSFANVRKKLGLSRTLHRRPIGGAKPGRKPGRPKASAAPVSAAGAAPDAMKLLQTAKDLLQACGGDAALAATALRQVAALQAK